MPFGIHHVTVIIKDQEYHTFAKDIVFNISNHGQNDSLTEVFVLKVIEDTLVGYQGEEVDGLLLTQQDEVVESDEISNQTQLRHSNNETLDQVNEKLPDANLINGTIEIDAIGTPTAIETHY